MEDTPTLRFADLALPAAILKAVDAIGYESPSPIQAATIPLLLSGKDVLGQAQTGTGKTAAFALPALAQIDLRAARPQVLVLAPTRELAIQVAEAFQTYASQMPGFHVLPIYGGQSYGPQLAALRRGVHVVVGTPGRIIDHLEKGSLDLSGLKTLVLDEADEMLRMGFIDDVESILNQTPPERQTALFSATMPPPIRRIAKTYLRDPQEVTVAAKTTTAENIRQRYWLVSGMHKLDALTRILEAEPFDAMIIFTRTKAGTEELADKLAARGFQAAAINGDMAQQSRERTIGLLKDGRIDILVATDVAARGLDVERISHVVNFDAPYDPESYTHRIGRTGRAGRSGDAILFIAPRERNLLKLIERTTRQPVSPLTLPTIREVNDARTARFKDQITQTLDAGGLDIFRTLVEEYERDHNVPAVEIAAALARIARGDEPLLLEKPDRSPRDERERNDARLLGTDTRPSRADFAAFPKKERVVLPPEPGMATYRIAVGYMHGVKPGNIVGAIANEAGLDSKQIGRIEIFDDYTVLDLPEDLSAAQQETLRGTVVAGQRLRIVRDGEPFAADVAPAPERPPKPRKEKKSEPKAMEFPMVTYRIEVGHQHAVKPANIVGAIANEAGLESRHIGRVDIFDDHSLVDLPEGMPKGLLDHMKKVWVAGQQLRMTRHGDAPDLPKPKKKKEKAK